MTEKDDACLSYRLKQTTVMETLHYQVERWNIGNVLNYSWVSCTMLCKPNNRYKSCDARKRDHATLRYATNRPNPQLRVAQTAMQNYRHRSYPNSALIPNIHVSSCTSIPIPTSCPSCYSRGCPGGYQHQDQQVHLPIPSLLPH